MTKRKKIPKPRYYVGYWVASLSILLLLIWRTIGSALYTLYVLADGFFKQGIIIFDQAVHGFFNSRVALNLFPFSLQALTSFIYLASAAVVVRFVSIFIIAQFVLPVSKWEERWKARNSFYSFIRGEKTLAVFVKEGNVIEGYGETEESSGGVVLADLSSAVALSQQKDTESWNIADEGRDIELDTINLLPNFLRKKKQGLFADAKGPGLIFLEDGQKISTAVDLRLQSRSEEVEAYTRNGIQIKGQVSVTFGLSSEPEVINVGHVLTPNGEAMCWLVIEEDISNGTMSIKEIYKLEPHDAAILESYARHDESGHYTEPEMSSSGLDTPYKFYRERVFNAAYSKARSVTTGDLIPWYEAPLEIAKDLFRREFLTIPYDDLYTGLDTTNRKEDKEAIQQNVDALKRLKDEFTRKMKLKGIVYFQYYQRDDGNPFTLNNPVPIQQVSKYPVISLTQHVFNSLRSVGVTIKSAGFSNIQPVNKGIKDRMVNNWKARWNKEVKFINAEHELESVRIQNRNRAQIQQEMTYLLSNIFQSSHTDEALALRVFQALETASVNPGGKNDMTPREVIDMLDSLHRWLLVDRKDLQSDKEDEKKNDAVNAQDSHDEKIL